MSKSDLEEQAARIVQASLSKLDVQGRFVTETAAELQGEVIEDALRGITGVQHDVVTLRTLVRDQIKRRFGELWRQRSDM